VTLLLQPKLQDGGERDASPSHTPSDGRTTSLCITFFIKKPRFLAIFQNFLNEALLLGR